MGTHVTDLNWEHGALVIIDMQNDFSLPDGAMPVAGAMEVIPSISRCFVPGAEKLGANHPYRPVL